MKYLQLFVIVSVLWALGTIAHDVRDAWNIPSNCACGHSSQNKAILGGGGNQNGVVNNAHLLNAVSQQLLHDDNKKSKSNKQQAPLVNGIDGGSSKRSELGSENSMIMMSPLNLLAEAASRESRDVTPTPDVSSSKKDGGSESSSSGKASGGSGTGSSSTAGADKCSTLRDLLTRQGMGIKAPPPDNNRKSKNISSNIDDVLMKLVQNKGGDGGDASGAAAAACVRNIKFSHYKPRSGHQMQGRKSPIPTYTLKETTVLFPNVPHSWLDHGRLLRLHDPRCADNLSLFQQQWRRAQPVQVSHCHHALNAELWTPQAFGKEFGHQENDLINCKNLVTILGRKMKDFWDGFETLSCKSCSHPS